MNFSVLYQKVLTDKDTNTGCVEVGREVGGTLGAGAVLVGSIVIKRMVALAGGPRQVA